MVDDLKSTSNSMFPFGVPKTEVAGPTQAELPLHCCSDPTSLEGARDIHGRCHREQMS